MLMLMELFCVLTVWQIYKSFVMIFLIYSWETHKERERGRDIEGEAGSLQGAPCGAQSWTLGSHPELKADAQPLSHPGIPSGDLFLPVNFTCFWALYILAYAIFLGVVFGNRFSCSILCLWDIAMSLHLAVSYSLHRSIEFLVWEEGQDGGRVVFPNHLSPQNYLGSLQIILKIYEFSLRFKERTAGMLQWEEFTLLSR